MVGTDVSDGFKLSVSSPFFSNNLLPSVLFTQASITSQFSNLNCCAHRFPGNIWSGKFLVVAIKQLMYSIVNDSLVYSFWYELTLVSNSFVKSLTCYCYATKENWYNKNFIETFKRMSLNTYLNMFNCTWMNFISIAFIWSMMTSELYIWT